MAMNLIDFFEFAFLWFRTQGLHLPRHQRRIARWLSALYAEKGNRRGLLMAFRNSGKSTLVGLFCAWLLYRNPSLRILVMAADYALAKKMVRNVKRIIEQHYLTAHLKPPRLDQWASDQFTVIREHELRDPSMLAKGLGANITGLRADIIICDDVEVPKTSGTALKRRELRNRLDELDYILTPQGMQLYIGTPHAFETIYQTERDEAQPESAPYLLGYSLLKLPLLDAEGRSQWPERFSDFDVASLRIRSGESKFRSQMLLEPVNLSQCRLNPERLCSYSGELALASSNGREILKIGETKLLSASCWWDPAFGNSGGDNSVIACVFTAEDGSVWLHDLEYIHIEANSQENVATAQCRRVIDFLRRNYLTTIRVEANGIGKFLPGILRQELRFNGLRTAVIEMYSHQNKAQRILEAFEVLLAERALRVHRRLWSTPFIDEMREWSSSGALHDDALDAVAGCLLSEPLRLPRCGFDLHSEPHSWSGASAQFSAWDKFDI